jgi:general secretion pathway protein G
MRRTRLRLQAGFSLIEIMVVVVIMAILASIIVPKIMSRPEQARKLKAKEDVMAIQNAADLYKLDNGFAPTTDQGLNALVSKPSTPPVPRDWKDGGYLDAVPLDPWGNPYQYLNEQGKLKIFSYGPEGANDSSDNTSMIGNWTSEAK